MQTIILSCLSCALAIASVVFHIWAHKRYKRACKRNEAVYKFRLWVLNNRSDLYDKLPSYDHMMQDNQPLTLESYLPELNN